MPAFLHSKTTKVLYEGFELAGYLKEAGISLAGDAIDATVFASTAKEYAPPAQLSGRVSASGFHDAGDPTTGSLSDKPVTQLGAQDTRVTIAYDGLTHGKRCRSVNCVQSSIAVASGLSELVAFNLEGEVCNAIAKAGVVLSNDAAITATNTGTSYDGSASSADGGLLVAHVVQSSGAAVLAIKVQHSADNSVWADLAGGSSGITVPSLAAGTKGAVHAQVPVGTTINRYLRAVITYTAGSGVSTKTHVTFTRG